MPIFFGIDSRFQKPIGLEQKIIRHLLNVIFQITCIGSIFLFVLVKFRTPLYYNNVYFKNPIKRNTKLHKYELRNIKFKGEGMG